MVRRSGLAVTGAHYGLKDWLAQRVTAVLMVIYLVMLACAIYFAAPQDFSDWKTLFSHQWFRIATFVFLICLLWHAWVGMRNVLMDYMYAIQLRLLAQITVIVALVGYLVWTADILWG